MCVNPIIDKRYKIVIADRNRNICELLRREFESEGYDVDIVSDGKELLFKINRDKSSDLLVLDLDLPFMDCDQILKSLEMRFPPLPVVIHSYPPEIGSQALLDYAAAFVEKGADPDLLKDVIAAELPVHKGPEKSIGEG